MRDIHTASSTDLDVKSGDAELLATGGDVLGSQHGGVGRGLVTVGLDLHATGDTADGFAATGITQNVSLMNRMSDYFTSNDCAGGGCFAVAVASQSSVQLPAAQLMAVLDQTNLRSVTWTKVSLKEAKIRATPKTSSPREGRRGKVSNACSCFILHRRQLSRSQD